MRFAHSQATRVPIATRARLADLRLEISLDVASYLSGKRVRVSLKDLNAGGCLVESALPMGLDAIQQLRFTTDRGEAITLIGRTVSCSQPPFGPANRWVVGFAFAHASIPSVHCQIAALIGSATRAPSLARVG